MREYVTLACTKCGNHNYRTSRETKNTKKLEIKKYCKFDRCHTVHKEQRK